MDNSFKADKRFVTFMLYASAACLINMFSSNTAGYADYFSNSVYLVGIFLLGLFCLLYRAGHKLTALLLSALFFNSFFTIFSFRFGLNSLICVYFFPFIISFIYMFQDECSKNYAKIFFLICACFITAVILFCPVDPVSPVVQPHHIVLMYKKNLIMSFLLSSYFFYAIFKYMIGQHKYLDAQKQLAEEASQAKARFLSVMSHELRTPLNGIVGTINLIDATPDKEDTKKYVSILKASSQHLLHLVNNVLDYSKASAGRIELNVVACQLDELFQNLYAVFLPRFEEKGLVLKLQFDTSLKQAVMIDDVRMVQVVTNLLSNALKFTERGEVCLQVACTGSSDGSVSIEVSVKDTGKGIPADQHTKIFDSFNSVHAPSQAVESTGLGLSISKMIIELMGSTIKLRSTPGVGSNFFFHLNLPYVQAKKLPVHVRHDEELVTLSNARVLVAEDNPVNMMVIKAFLKKWNINATVAANGLEAQNILKEDREFDLLLLDLQMPVMDGYELMEWMQTAKIPLPVIAFSANIFSHEEKEGLYRRGFVDTVPKPFSPQDLEQKMKKAIYKGQEAVAA
ncbi:MAG TPA: ATP-binding protein [Chitinophagaceae bacterium]|nr:ATP-binding protein [Chitinophagaceae bacterium]